MNQRSVRRSALTWLERMMKSVPNFVPRQSGYMALCRARASPKGFCRDCADRCGDAACPYLAERLAAGAASYNELAIAAFQSRKHIGLLHRVDRLSIKAGRFQFRSELHRSRLTARLAQTGAWGNSRWLAAVYLLTAREFLWLRTRGHIFSGTIRWSEVRPGSLDLQGYVLYKAAKGLYEGELNIRPDELVDRKLIDDETLLLVVNAVLLVRCGQAVLAVAQK